MKIKVCGIRDKENMLAVAQLQPDMLGFIFYPDSPRFMLDIIHPEDVSRLPDSITKIGVFVDASVKEILRISQQYHLDGVQLHGNESPEECAELKENGLIVFKAFGINSSFNWQALSAYADSCNYFLFDTASEKHGGTGERYNWKMLDQYTGNIPFLLSGGINPTVHNEILEMTHPMLAGIDVNSRFELSPGYKEVNLLRIFMENLNILKV